MSPTSYQAALLRGRLNTLVTDYLDIETSNIYSILHNINHNLFKIDLSIKVKYNYYFTLIVFNTLLKFNNIYLSDALPPAASICFLASSAASLATPS